MTAGGSHSSSGSVNIQTSGGSKTSINYGGKQEAVQLYPQHIELKLRISKYSLFH